PLQLIHRIAGALLRFVAGQAELLEEMAGVLRREIDQLAPRTALRRRDRRPFERRLDELALVGLEWNEGFGGPIIDRAIRSHEVGLEHGGVGLLLELREELVLARQQLTGA